MTRHAMSLLLWCCLVSAPLLAAAAIPPRVMLPMVYRSGIDVGN